MKDGCYTNVYFKRELSHNGEWGNIKIGESIDPEKRGKGLETGNSDRLVEIACIHDVPPSVERDLHRQFAEERIWVDKEWFKPSKRLLKYIDNVKRTKGYVTKSSPLVKLVLLFIAIFFLIVSCRLVTTIKPRQVIVPKPSHLKIDLPKPLPVEQVKSNANANAYLQRKSKWEAIKSKPFAKIKRNINADSQRKNELEKIKVSQDKAKEERYQKSYVAYKRKFRTPTDITLVTLHCDGIAYRGYVRNISNDYVDILSNGFIISLEKNKLSRSSKAICYRNDYAKYMASNNYK